MNTPNSQPKPSRDRLPGRRDARGNLLAELVYEKDITGATGKSSYLVRKVAEQRGIEYRVPVHSAKPRRHYPRADAVLICDILDGYAVR